MKNVVWQAACTKRPQRHSCDDSFGKAQVLEKVASKTVRTTQGAKVKRPALPPLGDLPPAHGRQVNMSLQRMRAYRRILKQLLVDDARALHVVSLLH